MAITKEEKYIQQISLLDTEFLYNTLCVYSSFMPLELETSIDAMEKELHERGIASPLLIRFRNKTEQT